MVRFECEVSDPQTLGGSSTSYLFTIHTDCPAYADLGVSTGAGDLRRIDVRRRYSEVRARLARALPRGRSCSRAGPRRPRDAARATLARAQSGDIARLLTPGALLHPLPVRSRWFARHIV